MCTTNEVRIMDTVADKMDFVQSHKSILCRNDFIFVFFFQRNPELIQRMRDDLRDECKKYGEVKKVVIYDVS